ncbi:MAG: phosphate ABC transporter permease PstA, partial [Candidatus Latescibacteria bacterium]|nr:phosphate ABC transporter permease PstA [Candidatus Latescibacterota bacterium]
LMIVGLVMLVLYNGMGFFWPSPLKAVTLKDEQMVMGPLWDRQEIPASNREGSNAFRIQIKTGNRDVYGSDFRWIDESDIVSVDFPEQAVTFERREWGNMYGFIHTVFEEDQQIAEGPVAGWDALLSQMEKVDELLDLIHEIEMGEIGDLNRQIESLRLKKREMERKGLTAEEIAAVDRESQHSWDTYEQVADQLTQLRKQSEIYQVQVRLIGGEMRQIATADIVRIYKPNQLGVVGKVGVYMSRVGEFLFDEPRESNTEGGVFPAIFGTVLMVFLMSLAAVPFGILAALYLREYAKQGPGVRMIRIAVNNLAGVPSIVFGMFGLGFFVYGIGSSVDQLFFQESLPAPTFGTGGILWASLTLALLTVPVMIVSTEEALAAVPSDVRAGSLALGATKLQTILRVVLPGALPGILTGVILVIARGAGEVAPLMITGVVKLAPALPLDGVWPFFHLERKFMHLGFHIYDVGFQSPNVEAARPMVYTTTLLLMGLVLALNLVAIMVRTRLRKRFAGSAF